MLSEKYTFGDSYAISADPPMLQKRGQDVKIGPTSLKILIYLFQHRGREIDVDELKDALGWHIEEVTVRGHISAIYAALGGIEHAKSIIWNDGHGKYLFRAPVRVVNDDRQNNSPLTTKFDKEIIRKIYLDYRAAPTGVIYSPELAAYLGKRYDCELFSFAGRAYPATVLWKNSDRIIAPDAVLGELDKTEPIPMTSSALLTPSEYHRARELVKRDAESGPVKHEGRDYRMIRIDPTANPPRIQGAKGLYYDYLLTQYSIAWELNKALAEAKSDPIKALQRPGALPLRDAVEDRCNPLVDGSGRCAALSVSTLLVFKRPDLPFHFILKHRSQNVMVMPGFLHVAPAGMFEAKHREEQWSVERNVWREMLEEVYDVKKEQGDAYPNLGDYILADPTIQLIKELIAQGGAEFSLTGVCCDLINLQTDICTVLFITDPAFSIQRRRILLNWEYEYDGPAGLIATSWDDIDTIIEREGRGGNIVASGAACLGLGREWVKRRHGI